MPTYAFVSDDVKWASSYQHNAGNIYRSPDGVIYLGHPSNTTSNPIITIIPVTSFSVITTLIARQLNHIWSAEKIVFHASSPSNVNTSAVYQMCSHLMKNDAATTTKIRVVAASETPLPALQNASPVWEQLVTTIFQPTTKPTSAPVCVVDSPCVIAILAVTSSHRCSAIVRVAHGTLKIGMNFTASFVTNDAFGPNRVFSIAQFTNNPSELREGDSGVVTFDADVDTNIPFLYSGRPGNGSTCVELDVATGSVPESNLEALQEITRVHSTWDSESMLCVTSYGLLKVHLGVPETSTPTPPTNVTVEVVNQIQVGEKDCAVLVFPNLCVGDRVVLVSPYKNKQSVVVPCVVRQIKAKPFTSLPVCPTTRFIDLKKEPITPSNRVSGVAVYIVDSTDSYPPELMKMKRPNVFIRCSESQGHAEIIRGMCALRGPRSLHPRVATQDDIEATALRKGLSMNSPHNSNLVIYDRPGGGVWYSIHTETVLISPPSVVHNTGWLCVGPNLSECFFQKFFRERNMEVLSGTFDTTTSTTQKEVPAPSLTENAFQYLGFRSTHVESSISTIDVLDEIESEYDRFPVIVRALLCMSCAAGDDIPNWKSSFHLPSDLISDQSTIMLILKYGLYLDFLTHLRPRANNYNHSLIRYEEPPLVDVSPTIVLSHKLLGIFVIDLPVLWPLSPFVDGFLTNYNEHSCYHVFRTRLSNLLGSATHTWNFQDALHPTGRTRYTTYGHCHSGLVIVGLHRSVRMRLQHTVKNHEGAEVCYLVRFAKPPGDFMRHPNIRRRVETGKIWITSMEKEYGPEKYIFAFRAFGKHVLEFNPISYFPCFELRIAYMTAHASLDTEGRSPRRMSVPCIHRQEIVIPLFEGTQRFVSPTPPTWIHL